MAGSNNVKADHHRKPPAPPGRAPTAELAEMVQLATKDSLLEALLDWIDGLVVVLNRHRQIVLAQALQYAWQEHRLVHRDIKPDNRLLDGSNQPKIADFGVARRAVPTDPRLTQASSFVGTIHYMAPEQAIGAGEADTRADLYGLGSTFFQLLSGETPFDGPNPTSILRRKLKRPAPPMESVCRALPTAFADTIQSLLATDPDDRPSDPGELLGRLTGIAKSGELSLES